MRRRKEPRDWVGEIVSERMLGTRRPLSQEQHNIVNASHPDTTIKHCPVCDTVIDDAQTYCSDECEKEGTNAEVTG